VSVALVTGGARGIGAAVARRLEAHGATVVVADRDPACGGEVVDVSSVPAVDALVDRIVARHGRLDWACNCAGVTAVLAPLTDLDERLFRRVMDVNAVGTFACLRAELRAMLAGGRGGAIVNVASGAASLGVPRAAAYAASKHAVAGLTRSAAIEVAAAGIRVNAVTPGLVRTPATAGLEDERFVAAHPIGRPVLAEEVAEVVWWLLAGAPAALTGALVPVDGGLTAQVAGLA
jgi:NAD(P)-dependent dehydrogenase (short-subunit alcohol dehydrogenase family)